MIEDANMSNFLYMLENTILWEQKKGKKKKEIYTSLGMAIFLMHFSPRVKFTVGYQKKKYRGKPVIKSLHDPQS